MNFNPQPKRTKIPPKHSQFNKEKRHILVQQIIVIYSPARKPYLRDVTTTQEKEFLKMSSEKETKKGGHGHEGKEEREKKGNRVETNSKGREKGM